MVTQSPFPHLHTALRAARRFSWRIEGILFDFLPTLFVSLSFRRNQGDVNTRFTQRLGTSSRMILAFTSWWSEQWVNASAFSVSLPSCHLALEGSMVTVMFSTMPRQMVQAHFYPTLGTVSLWWYIQRIAS
jgi:hypothetical protein